MYINETEKGIIDMADTNKVQVSMPAKEYVELCNRSNNFRELEKAVSEASIKVDLRYSTPDYRWEKEALEEIVIKLLTERAIECFLHDTELAWQVVKEDHKFCRGTTFNEYNWGSDNDVINLEEDSRTKEHWKAIKEELEKERGEESQNEESEE